MKGFLMSARWRNILIVILIFADFSVGTGEADKAYPEPWWCDYERKLLAEGVKTDTLPLVEAVRVSNEPEIRRLAIIVLGARGEQAAREPLRNSLTTDPDSTVRNAAAEALVRLGDDMGLATLRVQAEKTNAPVSRLNLIKLLAQAGDRSGFPYVREALFSDQEVPRRYAIEILPFFVDPEKENENEVEVVNLLLTFLRHPELRTRKVTLSAIIGTIQRGVDAERFRSAIRHLASTEPDRLLRLSAQYDLAELDRIETLDVDSETVCAPQ
jgi:hypothetical protein